MLGRRGAAAYAIALSLVFLTCSCAASPGAIKAKADLLPGVVEVRVLTSGGEADIPFSQPAQRAKVTMAADASAAELVAVFEAFADDVEAEDLTSIEVRFADDDSATLSTGSGILGTPRMAEELVDARDDPELIAYARVAAPVVREVYLELRDPRLQSALAAADRYLERRDIDIVTVQAGGFLLIRDRINARLAVTAARERLTTEVDEQIGLTGAAITGRGPLKLCAAPGDVAEVERYLDRDPRAGEVAPIGVVAATAEACGDIYL